MSSRPVIKLEFYSRLSNRRFVSSFCRPSGERDGISIITVSATVYDRRICTRAWVWMTWLGILLRIYSCIQDTHCSQRHNQYSDKTALINPFPIELQMTSIFLVQRYRPSRVREFTKRNIKKKINDLQFPTWNVQVKRDIDSSFYYILHDDIPVGILRRNITESYASAQIEIKAFDAYESFAIKLEFRVRRVRRGSGRSFRALINIKLRPPRVWL